MNQLRAVRTQPAGTVAASAELPLRRLPETTDAYYLGCVVDLVKAVIRRLLLQEYHVDKSKEQNDPNIHDQAFGGMVP
ncbi:MAG: hypothetical protein WA809_03450 [Candidatus Dormiibacterota bacterium]